MLSRFGPTVAVSACDVAGLKVAALHAHWSPVTETDLSVNQALLSSGLYCGPFTPIRSGGLTNLLAQGGGSTSSLLTSSVRRAGSLEPVVSCVLMYHLHARTFSSIWEPANSADILSRALRANVLRTVIGLSPVRGSTCKMPRIVSRLVSQNERICGKSQGISESRILQALGFRLLFLFCLVPN